MKVCWLSAGVSSFIAGYLEKDTIDEYIYIDIDDQHPDSMRFILDCEKSLNRKITILKSKYKNVENVVRKYRFLNSPYGAACTGILKKRVRKEWESQHLNTKLIYVWGFDKNEKKRAIRLDKAGLIDGYLNCYPLIERGMTKQDAHALLARIGIKRPVMYDLGYTNNNCVGCVKGGMGYWNKIRKDFPDVFAARSKLEREIGHTCIKDIYLDELDPNRGRLQDEISEECGIMCELNFENMKER